MNIMPISDFERLLDTHLAAILREDAVGKWRTEVMALAEARRHEGGLLLSEVAALPGAEGTGRLMGGQNVVLWDALTTDLVSALIELRVENVLRFVPCGPLPYLAAGTILRLPEAASAEAFRRGYRTPHWCPVVLVPGATPTDP